MSDTTEVVSAKLVPATSDLVGPGETTAAAEAPLLPAAERYAFGLPTSPGGRWSLRSLRSRPGSSIANSTVKSL